MDTDNILNALLDRKNHPFFGIFSLFVVICNFEALVILFIGNMDILVSLDYVKKNLVNMPRLLFFPFLLSTIYIISSEYIRYVIDNLQLKPLYLRHELTVIKERKESETRRRLMKIEKEEVTESIILKEEKSKLNTNDRRTYNNIRDEFSVDNIKLLRNSIYNGKVSKILIDKIGGYFDNYDLGEHVFIDKKAEDLYSKYIISLRDIFTSIIKQRYESYNETFIISDDNNSKDSLLEKTNELYRIYNSFNHYIKEVIL